MDSEWGSVQTFLRMKVKASEEETIRNNSHSGPSSEGKAFRIHSENKSGRLK